MVKIKKASCLLSFVLFMFVIGGCIHNNLSNTSFKVLSTTQIAYDNAMTITSDLYRENRITEEEKDKVIEIGDRFVKNYKKMANCLENYVENEQNQIYLDNATLEFTKVNSELMKYVSKLIAGKEGF